MSWKPTIHLNGSGRKNLLGPLRAAYQAAIEAHQAACAAAPHQRDYPDGFFHRASESHAEIVGKLHQAMTYFGGLWCDVDSQPTQPWERP